MEQEFLKEKAIWIGKMKRGDMAEAARIAGVKSHTFQEWMNAEEVGEWGISGRNLKAIKAAIRKREQHLVEAMAA